MGTRISKEFSPLSDVRGSKNYRTKIVSNLLDRLFLFGVIDFIGINLIIGNYEILSPIFTDKKLITVSSVIRSLPTTSIDLILSAYDEFVENITKLNIKTKVMKYLFFNI